MDHKMSSGEPREKEAGRYLRRSSESLILLGPTLGLFVFAVIIETGCEPVASFNVPTEAGDRLFD